MTEYMQLPEAIKHDRTDRRSMSRRVYAEATGLTEGRVHALENKRKLKPGELALLLPFVRDLIDPALAAAQGDEDTTPTRPDAPLPSGQEPGPPPPVADYEKDRQILGWKYLEVMNKLGQRIPPYPWPSQFRLETAPPIDFQGISDWLDLVSGWITEQEGEGTSETGAETSGAASEGGVGPQQPDTPPAPTAPSWDGSDETVDEEDWYQPEPAVPPGPAVTPTFSADGVVLDPNLWYLTNGEVSTFLDCERRWMLQNYYRLGPPTERLVGAAAIGSRFHAALAVWYRPDPGDPWEQFNASTAEDLERLADAEASDEVVKEYNSDTDMVRAMLEGYFDWISQTSIDNGLKIIGPEQVIEADPRFPGFPHVRLLCKLDVRVESERDQARMFLDHKTVGNFVDPLKGLQMNPQMLHYHLTEYLKLVAEGLDRELRTAGAYYNMARKVKRTASANPPFYMREPIKHNNEQLQSYWLKVKGVVEKIAIVRAALDQGADHREVAPPRPSDSCSWKCEFFPVCPMMDHSPQGAAAMLSEMYVQINPLKRYEPEAVGETL